LPILYSKIVEFEEKLSRPTREKLQCQKGCSQCCYVDLSVFEIEARAIINWFEQLTPTQRLAWLKKTQTPLKDGACAFLRDEQCIIYEARPLICRTQGLPLQFLNELNESTLDICPLNDKAIESLESHDVLNLDLLNKVLSQLEGQELRPRVALKDLLDQMKARAGF